MSHTSLLPVHRGFNSSLAMLSGAADHFTNTREGFVDMWLDDAPAHGLNGRGGAKCWLCAWRAQMKLRCRQRVPSGITSFQAPVRLAMTRKHSAD